jgi:transketolase
MRAEFANAMLALHPKDSRLILLSGDLGYRALEKVQETYGKKFINAGVAEQNMISVAAGLAYSGFIPWVYSIAPFAVLRPYEQIRNDVCLHNLPVKIVGNGGGYGYGIMGATHHVLEDIAIMRTLPNMQVYVPFVASDVEEAVGQMARNNAPSYLRLNTAAAWKSPVEPFRPWRKIKDGKKIIVAGTGPVLGNLEQFKDAPFFDDLEIWAISCFPIMDLPAAFCESVKMKKKVLTIEEHYEQGGLNEALAGLLLKKMKQTGITFKSLSAQGYPSGKYGSQKWHQEENKLEGQGLKRAVEEFIHE